jgi:hypothetical protein
MQNQKGYHTHMMESIKTWSFDRVKRTDGLRQRQEESCS